MSISLLIAYLSGYAISDVLLYCGGGFVIGSVLGIAIGDYYDD